MKKDSGLNVLRIILITVNQGKSTFKNSDFFVRARKLRADDCMDAGDRVPTVGSIGDVGNSYREPQCIS